MTSRLNVGSPAEPAAATARSTFAGSWVRPSDASTCGTIDCTPMDTRFTPAPTYVSRSSTVTSSGLHSTVTSAPAASGTARSTSARPAAGTSVGVPPPTNTLVAGAIPRCTSRSISVRSAWR
jgi:hypothetical protein